MKKALFVVLIVMLLVSMVIPAFAAAEKIPVCHHTSSDTNEWVLINISVNAWEAHEAHGDAQPGDDVPNMPGYAFDVSCNPEPSGPPNPPAGCYEDRLGNGEDIRYSGVENTLYNVAFLPSYDGSCSGDNLGDGTLVNANSRADAAAACNDLGETLLHTWESIGYSDLPATAWACFFYYEVP